MSTALEWFKSSYSGSEGGACLEVAYTWRKSSYSGSKGGQCVEVAACPHTIHIRDSKNPATDSPTLQLGPTAWAAFTATR
ncbi:DUF397 domain-containing protein [Streptomyces sp. NBC_01239]|uniref:DUF397 domain-containing protein n=1 Tax=Streptomyces sp. NBC_01239 TaxID=2903792 RepID=UPI00224CC584|nr:DUF397 domain-containing protein [Streptomyces sp. NBC_01239]MCX4811808.1 DUF397 domain-containing protein [Streptomyces sp. NBC_01239]